MAQDSVSDIVTGVTAALQGSRFAPIRPAKLDRFSGFFGESLAEWLEEVDVYCRQLQISESQKGDVILAHIDGSARREIRCHPEEKTTEEVIGILRKYFGSKQTVQSLQQAFYDRHQRKDETLMEFSREFS